MLTETGESSSNTAVTEAISIIEVHVQTEASSSCESRLSSLATTILGSPGCITYQALQSHTKKDLWIMTGLWESPQAMERHFCHPALSELINLLGPRSVKKVTANALPNSGTLSA
ncbi:MULTISPECIES: antibiotic biosynthesis monooxygenase [unclassified Pseudomonas]|uniref:antibiotic biosynthesis monooxygenase n=1 Tax=unclassified Pseudomonas TaxID=196821 RepID=UPI0030DDA2C1